MIPAYQNDKGYHTPPATRAPETGPMMKDIVLPLLPVPAPAPGSPKTDESHGLLKLVTTNTDASCSPHSEPDSENRTLERLDGHRRKP